MIRQIGVQDLSVLVHNRMPAIVVRSQHNAAVPAKMLCILQPPDQVGNASQAEAEADDGGPGAVGILRQYIFNSLRTQGSKEKLMRELTGSCCQNASHTSSLPGYGTPGNQQALGPR